MMKLSKIFFLPVLVFMSSATYAQDLFKTDDIYAIKSVSLSDISNDGSSLIFITGQANKKEDNFNNTLYFLDLKVEKKRYYFNLKVAEVLISHRRSFQMIQTQSISFHLVTRHQEKIILKFGL